MVNMMDPSDGERGIQSTNRGGSMPRKAAGSPALAGLGDVGVPELPDDGQAEPSAKEVNQALLEILKDMDPKPPRRTSDPKPAKQPAPNPAARPAAHAASDLTGPLGTLGARLADYQRAAVLAKQAGKKDDALFWLRRSKELQQEMNVLLARFPPPELGVAACAAVTNAVPATPTAQAPSGTVAAAAGASAAATADASAAAPRMGADVAGSGDMDVLAILRQQEAEEAALEAETDADALDDEDGCGAVGGAAEPTAEPSAEPRLALEAEADVAIVSARVAQFEIEAAEATGTADVEVLRELVRIKAEIEARAEARCPAPTALQPYPDSPAPTALPRQPCVFSPASSALPRPSW